MTSDDFSAFHKINQDETWYFHEGTSIKIHQIAPDGTYSFVTLGNNIIKKQQFQYTVPAEYWFGATVEKDNSYALVGCAVAPGFDFNDFVLANRHKMIDLFPQHTDIIKSLTKA